MKKLPIAATCMHNLDWLYDIHTLPPHLQETKSWKSLHFFVTSFVYHIDLHLAAPCAMEGKRKAEAGSSKDSKAARCVATPVRSTGVDKPNGFFCHRFVTFESWMMLDVCHHEMVWWVWWYSACHGALVTRFVQDLPSLESDSAGDWGFQGESRLWK